MKFDVSKLKELNELDFEQIAIWPNEVRIVVAAFVAILVGALSYYMLISPKLPIKDAAELKEQELKLQFEAKYRIAANLEAYQAQLAQIKEDFSSMLKSLPTSNETPGLLDDITYVGTASGLTFELLNWQQEVPKEVLHRTTYRNGSKRWLSQLWRIRFQSRRFTSYRYASRF